jgi:hypothetical protein
MVQHGVERLAVVQFGEGVILLKVKVQQRNHLLLEQKVQLRHNPCMRVDIGKSHNLEDVIHADISLDAVLEHVARRVQRLNEGIDQPKDLLMIQVGHTNGIVAVLGNIEAKLGSAPHLFQEQEFLEVGLFLD